MTNSLRQKLVQHVFDSANYRN